MRAPTRTSRGSPSMSRSRCSAWLAAGCDRPIRIAARLTLASSSRASRATRRLRSSAAKFISRIYIICTIDWKNDVSPAMMTHRAIDGVFGMSATENKQLMEQIYAGTANRDGTLFIQSLADDVSWCVTGQNKWSHTFKGKQAVLEDLQGYFQSLLVQRSRTVAHRFIADGDFVVVEARGDNLTKTGVRYDNEYCMVFRLSNGKIDRNFNQQIIVEGYARRSEHAIHASSLHSAIRSATAMRVAGVALIAASICGLLYSGL